MAHREWQDTFGDTGTDVRLGHVWEHITEIAIYQGGHMAGHSRTHLARQVGTHVSPYRGDTVPSLGHSEGFHE